MAVALYRDKEGRAVYEFPFILIVDPIMNRGSLYQNETAVDDDFLDDELMEEATPATVLPMLAARGYRVYYLRSEADLEDELLGYFAVADGQLQEVMAAVWIRQDLEIAGTEHVVWPETTVHLYTDGERVICEGFRITLDLPDDAPERPALEARVRAFLEAYARDVADELRVELKFMPKALATGHPPRS